MSSICQYANLQRAVTVLGIPSWRNVVSRINKIKILIYDTQIEREEEAMNRKREISYQDYTTSEHVLSIMKTLISRS